MKRFLTKWIRMPDRVKVKNGVHKDHVGDVLITYDKNVIVDVDGWSFSESKTNLEVISSHRKKVLLETPLNKYNYQ